MFLKNPAALLALPAILLLKDAAARSAAEIDGAGRVVGTGARGLNRKEKSAKKKAKSSKATSAPTDSPTASPEPGFEFGMAQESTGFWAGEEKYSSAAFRGPYDYCSTAMFQTHAIEPQENLLIYLAAYVGFNSSATCSTAGVNEVTGYVNGTWLREGGNDNTYYVLNIEQKKCLRQEECPYNVVEESGFYDNYAILEQSCGSHLKFDRNTGLNNCEQFQINLLEEETTGDFLVVAVMSYSDGVTGGYGNVTCPIQPTFDMETLMDEDADPNMDGMLLFVKQVDFNYTTDTVETITADWDCLL